MNFYRYSKIISLLFVFIFAVHLNGQAQAGDQLPVREYTNPDEMVTLDRTTPFSRALDVINEFAQKYRNKIIIDRTGTSGNIGISVPTMHWMDALKLILNVNQLRLIEQKDYYEIVSPESLQPQAKTSSGQSGSGEGEAPPATTHSQEVRIKAIFFEGNKRALQEIGVDWSTISENVPDAILSSGSQGGSSGGSGGQQGNTPQIPDSRFNGPFVQVNSKGAQSVSQNVFNSLINFGELGNTGIRVQALFSAFEADNLGQILASPNIKVLDGQTGRIQVGQDFSIKQRDFAGNVVENFFSVGTILEVTPQVIEQNDTTFVHLDIHAERSNAQPDPVSTIINKQQAETQALLLDGEATVIAGLYNSESTEVRKGIPILKDLPPWFFGLRYLFGYNSKDYQMRELVILLQASLEPTIPERIDQEFKGKYEILQEEREDMANEVQHGQEILKGKLKKTSEEPESMEADSASEGQNMTEKSEPEQKATEDKSSNMQKTTMPEEKENEEQAPAISDPEVHSEKVELNLGSDQSKEQEQMDADSVTSPKQKEPITKKESTTPSASDDQTDKYFIIGGSFKVEDNAIDFRDKLRKKGFDSAILAKKGSEILFVSYNGYQDLDSAKSGIDDIQQNVNPNAWLYIVK